MDKKCPSCGNNKDFTPTLVSEDYVCEECGSEFSESSHEAYTSPNYRMFCERVIVKMRSDINEAIISTAIGELSEGYINDGPEYAKDFINKLSSIATDLYIDYKAGIREKYDFSAIMEGVEKLIEFHDIQNPSDPTYDEEEEGEEEMGSDNDDSDDSKVDIKLPSEVFNDKDDENDLDPLSMFDDDAPPAEKTEHLALATLKNNVENLKNTLALLDNAEQQEIEDGSEEGPEHEEKEKQFMASIKDAVSQLQTSLVDYLDNESNAHYNAPSIRDKVDDVASKMNSETMDETVSGIGCQLKEICSEAEEMMSDCGYPVNEDAQLISQDEVDQNLGNSIKTNTQEFGNVVESVVGGHNVEGDQLTPDYPMPQPEEDIQALNTSNELVPPPDAYIGDPGFEDEREAAGEIEDIPIDDQFRENQSVMFEGEFWAIKGINENSLMLESDNGETIEVDKEHVELSNREGVDAMEEHYDRGTDNLRKAWEQIEESINKSKPMLNVRRTFDLREKFQMPGAIQRPKGYDPSKPFDPEATVGGYKPDFKSGKSAFDPEETIGNKVDVDSQAVPKDSFKSMDKAKKKTKDGKVFEFVRIVATPKEGGDNVVFYDVVNVGEKFYLQKSVRAADKTTKLSEPENLAKGESKDKVMSLLRDVTDINPRKQSEFENMLGSISGVTEALLPNSNLQIK